MKLGTALLTLAMCATVATLSASGGPPVSIEARAKSSQLVVVASVADVQSAYAVSPYGDEIIMSNLRLNIEETMKGNAPARLSIAVEGGTVGDITLRVSDLPSMARGDRAVLFLDETTGGAHVPHGRGQGILKLTGEQVSGTNLTLADVRRSVRQAATK